MGEILEEVKVWNTPVIGSYLLWRFTKGYTAGHPNGDAPIGLLHFVAAGILTSRTLSTPISNKRPDLQSYARSFEENKNSDILLTVHERVKEKLDYTMKAIDIAVAKGLLFWEVDSGKLYAKANVNKPQRGNSLRSMHEQIGNKAEILGSWFGKHDIATIAKYLSIVF